VKTAIVAVLAVIVCAGLAQAKGKHYASGWKNEACSVFIVHLVGPVWNEKPKFRSEAYELPSWVSVVPKEEPSQGELRYTIYRGDSDVEVNDLDAHAGYDYFFKLGLYKDGQLIHEWEDSYFVGSYTETTGTSTRIRQLPFSPHYTLKKLVKKYQKLHCK